MTLHRRRARRVGPVALAALAVSCLWAAGLAVAVADEPTGDAIAWRDDYGAAFDEARGSGRLLWIQFTGPWCPNCTRMEHDSFSQTIIRARAREGFVPVKLQADANMDLAVGFGLSGLPASVVVDSARRVVEIHQGYLGPEELDGFLRRAIALNPPRPAADSTALAAQTEAREPGAASSAGSTELVGPPRPVAAKTDVALSGFCPVSLVAEKRLVRGQSEYTAIHQGRSYRFASLVTFNRFQRNPETYVPANEGRCPVKQVDENQTAAGDPRFGVLYQGRLFLCASNADRQRFLKAPARYAAVEVAEGGFCPHCIAESGQYVQGDPRFTATRQGHRYWFPDATHRDAFLALSTADSTWR